MFARINPKTVKTPKATSTHIWLKLSRNPFRMTSYIFRHLAEFLPRFWLKFILTEKLSSNQFIFYETASGVIPIVSVKR